MTSVKPWYSSRTVWAAIVTVLMALCGLFGVPLDGFHESEMADALLQAATAIAGIVALIGRLVAKSRIG
ncbi:hypothetical protein KEU06_19450 [Pseudaminobacter sp. 19-2017]|uniref:Holin n=1 Tax=Pseudaminobacter soli (ex Zhang et al. 2022) TaxID=2831468 RepID=A0A942DZZ4_9HYPH|nr:hypothetical protein [Pseudaminobacter soli]MBS3650791.1 hypothetical protein [Pseudaminobacter soli]